MYHEINLTYSKYIFFKVILEPSVSEFEGEKIKVFIAIIFVHMCALRDGNCGPTSAKGAYLYLTMTEKETVTIVIIILFNTYNTAIITNEYDD